MRRRLTKSTPMPTVLVTAVASRRRRGAKTRSPGKQFYPDLCRSARLAPSFDVGDPHSARCPSDRRHLLADGTGRCLADPIDGA